MSSFDTIANDEIIQKTAQALTANGFEVHVAESQEAAKELVLSIVPKGAETFTNSSKTLDELGLSEALNSEDFVSGRDKMMALWGDEEKTQEMKQIAATPEYALSSAHAITEDGKILIASASGSQLPSQSYGAENVVLVVGAQKIVKDLSEGIERIEEYVVPLEDKRAMEVYGSPTSFNKLLVLAKEPVAGRTKVVLVKDSLGF